MMYARDFLTRCMCGIALAACLAVASDGRCADVGAGCEPKIERLCRLLPLHGREGEREFASAIDSGLTSTDREEQELTFRFLGNRFHSIDPRAYRSAILRFDELNDWHDGELLLEQADLYYSGRSVRVGVYRTAIAQGSVKAGRLLVIDRGLAIRLAAHEGLDELRPDVRANFADLSPSDSAMMPLDDVMASMDLRGGAGEDRDLARHAARRLADLPETELAQNLVKSEGWRRVVFLTARECCEETKAEQCQRVRAVVLRQLEIARRASAEQQELTRRGLSQPTSDSKRDWMQQLGAVVGVAGAAQ